jgi:hypothetical protein
LYVDVNSAGQDKGFRAPGCIEELVAGEDNLGVCHKVAQQPEFSRTQDHLFASNTGLMGGEIHVKGLVLKDLWLA